MGLIETGAIFLEVNKVFAFLRDLFNSLPPVIYLVGVGAFGSVVLVGLLRGVGR